MRSYLTARSIFSFMEFVSWIVVILGAMVAFIAFNAAQRSGFSRLDGVAGMIAAMPGVIVSLVGVMNVMLVQIGRAGVDTAEMTGQLLQLSRKQLEVSEASYRHQRETRHGRTTLQADAGESTAAKAETVQRQMADMVPRDPAAWPKAEKPDAENPAAWPKTPRPDPVRQLPEEPVADKVESEVVPAPTRLQAPRDAQVRVPTGNFDAVSRADGLEIELTEKDFEDMLRGPERG